MQFIIAHKVELLAALLAVSELLDAIPALNASSIWKLALDALKAIAKK